MKHLGIKSLCIGSLMLALLDIAPSPGGCSHESYHSHRPQSADVQTCAKTGKVINYGTTWAEVSGRVYPSLLPAYCNLVEFGIEYRVKGKVPLSNVKIAVEELDYTDFVVRLNGLNPNTEYECFTYLDCTNKVSYQGSVIQFKTSDTDEANLPK